MIRQRSDLVKSWLCLTFVQQAIIRVCHVIHVRFDHVYVWTRVGWHARTVAFGLLSHALTLAFLHAVVGFESFFISYHGVIRQVVYGVRVDVSCVYHCVNCNMIRAIMQLGSCGTLDSDDVIRIPGSLRP